MWEDVKSCNKRSAFERINVGRLIPKLDDTSVHALLYGR